MKLMQFYFELKMSIIVHALNGPYIDVLFLYDKTCIDSACLFYDLSVK